MSKRGFSATHHLPSALLPPPPTLTELGEPTAGLSTCQLGMPGLGPSGALEDTHAASTPPLGAGQILPFPYSQGGRTAGSRLRSGWAQPHFS